MAMVGWVSYARLVRAQVLTLKQRDFILAVRSLGYGHTRILFRHLLPNALTGALVFSMSDCVLVLLNGAAVSYLGLGVQPPTAEWGVMVAEGQSFITTAWWITTFPGLAIVLLAMGFSLIADGPRATNWESEYDLAEGNAVNHFPRAGHCAGGQGLFSAERRGRCWDWWARAVPGKPSPAGR